MTGTKGLVIRRGIGVEWSGLIYAVLISKVIEYKRKKEKQNAAGTTIIVLLTGSVDSTLPKNNIIISRSIN